MDRLIIIILLVAAPCVSFSQQAAKKPNIEEVKAQMVLRANTRDQVRIVKDNLHQKQMLQRRKAVIMRQQKMMQQRRIQINRRQQKKQRLIQQRKLRQKAMRRRQMQRRR